jgi:hypothetical protein
MQDLKLTLQIDRSNINKLTCSPYYNDEIYNKKYSLTSFSNDVLNETELFVNTIEEVNIIYSIHFL